MECRLSKIYCRKLANYVIVVTEKSKNIKSRYLQTLVGSELPKEVTAIKISEHSDNNLILDV